MRTIKFRGKSKIDGKWFFGNLYDKDKSGRTHICTITKGCLDIDPETVGQFTGMKTKGTLIDPEQKDIYEDDIMRIPQNMFHIEIIGRVVFEAGRFRVKSLLSGSMWDLETAIAEGVEIIGNAHDNPELLGKGGTDEE